MCEALVQFLAEELEGRTNDIAIAQNDEEVITSVDQNLKASKKPLFRAQAAKGKQIPAQLPVSKTANDALVDDATAPSTVKKSGKDWEDMTVVWKSNIGIMKGARPRRMMTEEERTDYRMRRVRGACVACKRKKRKCNHDSDLSPSSSSDTVGTLTPTLQTATLKSETGGQPSQLSIGRDLNAVAKQIHRSAGSSLSRQTASRPIIEAPHIHTNFKSKVVPQRGDDTKTAPQAQYAIANNHHLQSSNETFSLSQTPSLDDWQNFLQTQSLLDLQSPNLSTGILDFLTDDLAGFDAPFGLWETTDPGFNVDMAVSANQPSPPVLPMDSVPLSEQNQRKTLNMPPGAQLENRWTRAQDQVHIEQWLDQKVIEECSAPRNPELEVQQEAEINDTNTASSRRRRVKFDFSSLIDGPPTLSTSPAGILEEQDLKASFRQDPPRLKRSSSRHSTGSRMSFSDINSISSAFTSMSIRESESMRGSIHSATSDRNLMMDDSGDEDEKPRANAMTDTVVSDSNESSGSSVDSSSEADDDVESIDWEEWLVKDNDSSLSRKELQLDKNLRQRQ